MSDTPAAVLSAVVTATPDVAAFVDANGDVRWLNPALVPQWPAGNTLRGGDLLEAVHPDDHEVLRAAWELVTSRAHRTVVRQVRLGCGPADQSPRVGRVRLTRIDTGAVAGSVVIHVEALAGQRDDERSDPLTGLPDRLALFAHLDDAVAADRCVALVLLDLDEFHVVNETMGFAVGDEVLVALARRLLDCVPDGDLVARIDGDEFAVVCCNADVAVDGVVGVIHTEVQRPIELADGTTHSAGCSIGVASKEVLTTALDALGCAESAVRLAKSHGGAQTVVFDAALRESATTTLRRTAECRRAAANGELVLHYQPIVELSSGETAGCEALLRWQHPTDGLLNAGEFIDIAESSGVVNTLTEQLLHDACAAARRLSTLGRTPRTRYVSLNLSPQQLVDVRLVGRVRQAVEQAEICPSQLMIEITERTVLSDIQATLATLSALRELGVRIALDDFGTGFSSLIRLRELPVTCLKVDRAFVGGVARSDEDLAIVATVVHMAQTLGLDCVAEGVEAQEQADQLRRIGCHAGQGFLWSRAVPVDEVPVAPGRSSARRTRAGAASAADPATEAWIMRLHRSGTSLLTIAAVLNQSGARTIRGTRWHARSVADVVSRAAFPQLHD